MGFSRRYLLYLAINLCTYNPNTFLQIKYLVRLFSLGFLSGCLVYVRT